MLDFLDNSAAQVLPLLATASLKGGAMLLVLGLVIRLTQRWTSAAQRHLLWFLAMASLPILLALPVFIPGWYLPIAPSWACTTSPDRTPQPLLILAETAQLPIDAPPAIRSAEPGFGGANSKKTLNVLAEKREPIANDAGWQSARPPWQWISSVNLQRSVFLIWLGGFGLLLARLALGAFKLQQLQNSARDVNRGPLWNSLCDVVRENPIRRKLVLLQSGARSIPMTWGNVRPVILLPAQAVEWSADRVHMVLHHELAHIRRWDCLTQTLAYVFRALFWFHPLVWWAGSRQRLEQEHACDDEVVRNEFEAAEYAEHLLAVGGGCSQHFLVSPVTLAMTRTTHLQKRLMSLLNPRQRRNAMNRRTLCLLILLAACLTVPLALVSGAAAVSDATAAAGGQSTEGAATGKDPIAEVQRILRERYVKPVDNKKLTQDAIKGMLKALGDDYSTYISTEQLRSYNKNLGGKFVGIGAQLRMQDKRPAVVTPLPNSPALKAGLRPGDLILKIDGKETRGLDLRECVKLIVGELNTTVQLEIRREGQPKTVKIKRGPIMLSSVKGFSRDKKHRWNYLLDPQQKIGYLRITAFKRNTADEVADALRQLEAKKTKGLILDLRNCPGGLLQQAIAVSDMFLAKGTIVTLKGTKNLNKSWTAKKQGAFADAPMLVLINPNTASAAEIVAGALKDNKRAVLLGARTYGKGSVQSLIGLNDGAALKLTTAFHYLPSGRNIQKRTGGNRWGVDPNDGFYLPMTAKQRNDWAKKTALRDLIGGNHKLVQEPLTPTKIADVFADAQLAAAMKAMLRHIKDGKFPKVGRPLKDLTDQVERIRELHQRQETLQRELQDVNRKLEGLTKKQ